ncbi:hypothetical protein AV530_008171 [Patagioenas fasciata monilis]|uniref:Uncharacterized protein n=1 Tax=Patagioenas fasciata monilis TaxID=372326 RepID=A0A1V4KUR8_PATFA|nr:hypothetical protein AV530_008171 [Patagioenas fasciata monilis]
MGKICEQQAKPAMPAGGKTTLTHLLASPSSTASPSLIKDTSEESVQVHQSRGESSQLYRLQAPQRQRHQRAGWISPDEHMELALIITQHISWKPTQCLEDTKTQTTGKRIWSKRCGSQSLAKRKGIVKEPRLDVFLLCLMPAAASNQDTSSCGKS